VLGHLGGSLLSAAPFLPVVWRRQTRRRQPSRAREAGLLGPVLGQTHPKGLRRWIGRSPRAERSGGHGRTGAVTSRRESERTAEHPHYQERSAISRSLSWLDRRASHPLLAVTLLTASAAWLVISVILGFPSGPERIFQTLVGAVTLAMVFVIQHTQAREQSATQRKLDEILKALPDADNKLLTLEHASDRELRATREDHTAVRRAALDDDNGSERDQPDGE
jgi:low affinity Fe/Cu permease